MKHLTIAILLLTIGMVRAQVKKIEAIPENWTTSNCEVDYEHGDIYLKTGDEGGALWLNDFNFTNGVVEFDIKGRDRAPNYIGLAFHITNEKVYDAIYFRPFNFTNPVKKNYSVQYIAEPDYGWSKLRKTHPDKYENAIEPAPVPSEWFHAKIVVNYPSVKVYVNGASEPSLEVEQLNDRKSGKLGLWVGYRSDCWFRNVEVKPSKK